MHVKMKAEIRVMGGFYKPRNAKTANKAPEAQRETEHSPCPLSVGSSLGDKNWIRVRGCILTCASCYNKQGPDLSG